MEEENELMKENNKEQYTKKDDVPRVHRIPKSQFEIIGAKVWEIILIIEHYIHAIISVLVASFVIYYTNIFYNFFYNQNVNSFYFALTLVFFTIFTGIICYISFYLPFTTPNEEEFNKKFNQIIRYCAIFGILFLICLISSIWHLYRIYSIGIVISIAWGIIMSANFAPSGIIGNIFFIIILIGAASSGKFIDHNGHTYV